LTVKGNSDEALAGLILPFDVKLDGSVREFGIGDPS
jgi:hypothetical protein